MDELLLHKDLVSQWEKAEAELTAVKSFKDAGGDMRLQVSCQGAPGVEEIINRLLLDSRGMELILGHCLNRANAVRSQARAAVFGKGAAA